VREGNEYFVENPLELSFKRKNVTRYLFSFRGAKEMLTPRVNLDFLEADSRV
jgi:hypothetical protein